MTVVVPRPTMNFLVLATIVALLTTEVRAHTRVWSIWLKGSDQGAGAGRYIRQPPKNGPVKRLTSSDIRCNTNGYNPVGTYVPIPAGGTVTTEWCTWVTPPLDQLGSHLFLDHDSRGDDIVAASHKGPIRT